jgi:small-conductance mechanosensitive channel
MWKPFEIEFRVERFMRITIAAGLLLALLSVAQLSLAQGTDANAHPDASVSLAKVEIDGALLFRVVGVPALPANERATAVTARIEAVAADSSFKPEDIVAIESDLGTAIMARDVRLILVTDDDSRLEGLDRKVIAEVYVTRLRKAIDDWRAARAPGALKSALLLSLAGTVAFALAMALLVWISRRARARMQRYRTRIHSVGIQSFQVVRAGRIWGLLSRALSVVITFAYAALMFVYLDYVLRLFPWTRGASIKLMSYVLEPLNVLGKGILNELPSLVFLLVLLVVIRWLLKVIHLFFAAVGRAEVSIDGFDPEWAEPTYKIVRVLVIAFALVVAYPYIPGSSSDAFKGISLFVGLVFSLGSSSIVANILAGYMLTYRRAFKVGDRVKIGDTTGIVIATRMQVTHLRTFKNEEVTVPNSVILSSEVVNYTALAKTDGLILHTTVGIGYETPWRQVEAMLKEAARRTEGLQAEPAPFVLQKSLGDFAVTYEINAYCSNPQQIATLYTNLHRNILDVFNEFGVQIMTPAYEGDTPDPKVVPKDRWFTAPALPETK